MCEKHLILGFESRHTKTMKTNLRLKTSGKMTVMAFLFLAAFLFFFFGSDFSATILHLSVSPCYAKIGSSVTKSSEYSMQSAVSYITL